MKMKMKKMTMNKVLAWQMIFNEMTLIEMEVK